jgi:hypothetical protein
MPVATERIRVVRAPSTSELSAQRAGRCIGSRYSVLNTTMGSVLAARRAGK